MRTERRLGVLGGTFDPIHNGHLRAGEAAQAELTLDEMRVLPTHDPPHRPIGPRASTFHRFALAALAIEGRPTWRLSDAELTRSGRTYTAHTLQALHEEGWSALQIFFILGSDAFAEIATWYAFPAVLDAANFVVIARPGTELHDAAGRSEALGPRLRALPRRTDTVAADAVTGIFLVEADTPDISSSDIRRRLAARLPIEDLVPESVARYIHNHGLYR